MNCLKCGKELIKPKRKYCDEHCKYWYLAIKNNKPKKRSVPQDLRMVKAGRRQFKGKIGTRLN